MDDGDIFEKPKRKLSAKQLENLAKGREKMRLKRLAAKGEKEVKTADKSGAKEHMKVEKAAIKKKRRTMKDVAEQKQQDILKKLEEKEAKRAKQMDDLEGQYLGMKTRCLAQAKSVAEYSEIKEALEGLTGDVLSDDTKLKAYAQQVMSRYTNNISVDSKEDAEEEREGFDDLSDQDE